MQRHLYSPYAYFDCVSIATKLQPPLGDVSMAEIHLFAYLACLLSLYKSRPLADWTYGFVGTRDGAPYSREIQVALELLQQTDAMEQVDGRLQLTLVGRREYDQLITLTQNAEREPFIAGACASVLALPVGIVRSALSQEPELRRAIALSSTRQLLEEPGLQLLYEHFSALSAAVGVDVDDLMVPATVWLTYLSRITQASDERNSPR